MILTRTPVRISFLGGGTDYPAWFHKHGGMVVGTAIDKYSVVKASYLPPFHHYKTRLVYSGVEEVASHDQIQHRAARESLAWLGIDDGLEIVHTADIPGRSGTGSSSTFVVGLVNALGKLAGRHMAPDELAAAAIDIEQNRMGETVGCQDQTWAAHGGLNVIKFRRSGDIGVFPLGLNRDQVEDLERHLLLFFSGQSRTSSDVAKKYAANIGSREREHWAMLRLAEDGAEALLRNDHERLGRLMNEAWRIKSGLADGVNTDTLSALYNTALVYGAWGGKVMGAGGGGCIVLAAPPEKQSKIITALTGQGAVHIPFRCDFDGSVVLYSGKHWRGR